jgi:serine/threonine-protein kinase
MIDPAARLRAPLADRYRIERELGRGGMATVFLAHDLRHDRPVALKTLHPELAASLGSDRFLREIKLAARLQHPHILSVHDSGEAAGILWFTMPYVEGESLRDRLRREHQLPLDDAVRITHEAARALDYAHRHGVVHRDIKPENILLTKDGDTLVADFGIGRALGGTGPEERLTETGIVVGTPAYMSPEQAAGERELDGRTDVYSLAVVLYEMLAGEPPFTGATAQAITARRLTETPRPLRPVRESVPQELEQLVLRALARAPADRPATAAAFAETLDAVRRSGTVATAPAQLATPVRRTRVPRKWLAGLLGGVIAAALLGTLLRSRTGARPELDASLLAVAPFDVLDSKLGLWREGMVDLLSRNLDGAGALRTVSPTVIIRRWRGRADPASAADLGRRTGAGLALYGSLLGAGPDSVRVRATLFDVKRQSTLEEWELTETADRVDRLADSLTIRLLLGLGRTRPIGGVRFAGFGSRSLPAVRAFLQGEQHLRRSEWDSALGYYERAVRLDSTFPLALRRASTALGWIRTGYDSLSNAYALRAGGANHGLAPRDSLLLTLDSLMAALFQAGPLGLRADTLWGVQLSRLFATAAQATSRYPGDPDAWFTAGEAHDHFGRFAGYTNEQELQAFDRAIALDSAFAPSYIHPIELASVAGPDAMRRYLRPYLALVPKDVNAGGLRLVQAILDSGPVSNLAARLAGVPPEGMFASFLALSHFPDSAEVASDIARFMIGHTEAGGSPNDSSFARRQLARNLLSRGHLRAGYRAGGQLLGLNLSEATLFGAVPAESIAPALRERLSGAVGASLVIAFPWWARRQDTASLRTAAARAESLAHSSRSGNPRLAAYVARSAGAYLALVRGDSVKALEDLLGLSAGDCPACYYDRLTLAQLLLEQRRDREAWQMLQAKPPGVAITAMPSGVIWSLLRGRAAERVGERERAIQSYGWVAGMWRNADPELQPYVTEAREGLARLTSERK